MADFRYGMSIIGEGYLMNTRQDTGTVHVKHVYSIKVACTIEGQEIVLEKAEIQAHLG